jgi:hypothetical protein
LCLKWNDPSLLFLLHMLDLSLPLLKFFFGFLIVTPPESHLSLILANWTIQFLPAPEKSSNWSFFLKFRIVVPWFPLPNKNNWFSRVLYTYVHLWPFQAALHFFFGFTSIHFLCVSVCLDYLLSFLLPSSPWILCLPTWSRPRPPTTPPHFQDDSLCRNKKKKNIMKRTGKILYLLDCHFSLFCRVCVCVCACADLLFNLLNSRREELLPPPPPPPTHHFFTSHNS